MAKYSALKPDFQRILRIFLAIAVVAAGIMFYAEGARILPIIIIAFLVGIAIIAFTKVQ